MAAQRLNILTLLVIWSVCLSAGASSTAASPSGPAYPTADAWQSGRLDGLEAARDGSLQLSPGRTDGWFETAVVPVTPAAVLAVEQRLVQPPLTAVVTAWRSAAGSGDAARWGAWQVLETTVVAADERQVLLPLPADALQVQLGVLLLGAAGVSPQLELLGWRELPALSTAALTAGLPQRPLLNGPPTAAARPLLVGRNVWHDGRPLALPPAQTPRRLRLQLLPATVAGREAAYLRLLRDEQLQRAQAADISLHYLIAADGRLLEGVAGGPTREVLPYAGDGEVMIAITAADAGLSDAQATTLAGLAAWLCSAYPAIDCLPTTLPLPAADQLQRYRLTPLPSLPADLADRIAARRVTGRLLFAAGTTVAVSQRLTLANPAQTAATVELQMPDAAGALWQRQVLLPPRSRSELLLEAWLPNAASLPLTVTTTGLVAVERRQLVAGELESANGRSAARRWYFADAAPSDAREVELVLLNPQRGSSDVRLTLVGSSGVLLEQTLTLAAGEQRRVLLQDIAAAAKSADFGLMISSARPIAVERLRRGDGQPTALAGSTGTTQPARRWYFAEGTTEDGWRQQLILLNPAGVGSTVELVFRGENGLIARQRFTLPPLRRLVIDAAQFAAGRGAAVEIDADRPIVAERLLWRSDRAAAALNPGLTLPAQRWLFASLRTRAAEAYLILLNPGERDAVTTLEVFGDGADARLTVTVPAGSRRVLALHQQWPERSGAALLVDSTAPLVVEQAVLPTGIRGGFTVEQPVPLPAAISAAPAAAAQP
jgi:hypothetical protein